MDGTTIGRWQELDAVRSGKNKWDQQDATNKRADDGSWHGSKRKIPHFFLLPQTPLLDLLLTCFQGHHRRYATEWMHFFRATTSQQNFYRKRFSELYSAPRAFLIFRSTFYCDRALHHLSLVRNHFPHNIPHYIVVYTPRCQFMQINNCRRTRSKQQMDRLGDRSLSCPEECYLSKGMLLGVRETSK